MFEKASRLKLRFDSPKGLLSTEDLWDLPLTSNTGRANLDDIARALFGQLKSDTNISFVNADQKSDTADQLKFDVVKHIIDVRLKERAEAAVASERAAKKQLIMSIIAEKETDGLKGASLEDLRKQLEAL